MIGSIGHVIRIPEDFLQSSEKSETPQIKDIVKISENNLQEEDNQVYGEINEDQVQQAVNQLNKTMETYNTELRFKFHEKSGEYMVKIVNPKDNSVIRELPPEKVLDMVAYFKKILGIVVDKFA